jgi:hypothetical protein
MESRIVYVFSPEDGYVSYTTRPFLNCVGTGSGALGSVMGSIIKARRNGYRLVFDRPAAPPSNGLPSMSMDSGLDNATEEMIDELTDPFRGSDALV